MAQGPKLDPAHAWAWRAWHRLDSERHWKAVGMGPPIPCDIPWTAVVRWCEVFGYPLEQLDELDKAIGRMDKVFHKWYADSLPKDKKGSGGGNSG